jgi:iron complex transport system permease protein
MLIAMVSALFLFLDARLCLAFWVGLGLTASGAALQGLFQNSLADPYIIGVSGGACLFGSLSLILFGSNHTLILPLSSMLGALTVCLLLVKISTNESVLLAGLLINAFSSSLISLIKSLLPTEKTQSLLFWLLGTVTELDFKTLLCAGACILTSVFILIQKSWVIERLSLGDDEAMRLGLNPHYEKRMIHLSISLIVGATVSFCGFIGFVGLLVPQMVRIVLGSDQRILIPVSALSGAFILVFFDFISQKIQIPTGVLTALAGTPLFGILAYAAHKTRNDYSHHRS